MEEDSTNAAEDGTKSGLKSDQKQEAETSGAESSTTVSGEKTTFARIRRSQVWSFLTWTPKRCRWDPASPPKFSMGLNLLFAFVSIWWRPHFSVGLANYDQAGTFTVANLYYNHPILNILAEDFHVTNERSSLIPTMMQAGYAAGLLFLCPLGDLLKRRPFVLILVFFTATIVSLKLYFHEPL